MIGITCARLVVIDITHAIDKLPRDSGLAGAIGQVVMVEADDADRGLTLRQRHPLSLAAVELALLVAELVLLGDLEGRLAAAGFGHGVGDLRELGPAVLVDLPLDLDALERILLGFLRRLLRGGVRRGWSHELHGATRDEGADREHDRCYQ